MRTFKRTIPTFLLTCICTVTFNQTPQQNLNKYLDYREAFFNKFIVDIDLWVFLIEIIACWLKEVSNMKKNFIRVIGLMTLGLAMNSCFCPDDVEYRYPKEFIRYYDDHDTIKFYSSETQTYEIFIVCRRITEHEYEISRDRCEQETHYYSRYYECFKDSCNSGEFYRLNIEGGHKHYIIYHGFYANTLLDDDLSAIYENSPKYPVEILGHTYENTISLVSHVIDSIESILYTHEYGVIQRNYENVTFNFVNDEN